MLIQCWDLSQKLWTCGEREAEEKTNQVVLYECNRRVVGGCRALSDSSGKKTQDYFGDGQRDGMYQRSRASVNQFNRAESPGS